MQHLECRMLCFIHLVLDLFKILHFFYLLQIPIQFVLANIHFSWVNICWHCICGAHINNIRALIESALQNNSLSTMCVDKGCANWSRYTTRNKYPDPSLQFHETNIDRRDDHVANYFATLTIDKSQKSSKCWSNMHSCEHGLSIWIAWQFCKQRVR